MVYEFTKAALYGMKRFNEGVNKKVKELMRMEKLIMLIDIYEEEVVGVHSVGEKITDKEEARIISKQFGFIKRLVEKDKIDRERLGNSETKSSKYSDFELSYDTPREDYTNTLLMELALQDEPIEFLAFILK